MQKAIIYTRVSSARQVKEGDGLGSQEQRCRKYAINCGYKVLRVFKEQGESGGLFDRTEMQKLLSFLGEYNKRNPEEKVVVIFDDLNPVSYTHLIERFA